MPTSIELNSENFQSSQSSWSWKTPGVHHPQHPWSAGIGPTPTAASGPNGGANTSTHAIEAGNPYAFTEASESPAASRIFTMESPEFNASLGVITLTFDVHMRFGSEGDQSDGTLKIQGWNGLAWSDIGPAITGSQQNSPDQPYKSSTAFGIFDSTGFDNSGFKFRFRFEEGSVVIQPSGAIANYDCAIDNVVVVGPEGGQPGLTNREIALNSGLRTVFVSKAGSDSHSGLSADRAKRTIQAGINMLQAGDVLQIDDGVYDEELNVSNRRGTRDRPILIAARNANQVFVDSLWQEARNGTQNWDSVGGGVFRARHKRPYMGEHNGDYLQYYKSRTDLEADSITAFSAIAGGNRTIKKPPYGFAFEPDGGSTSANANGTVFVRLRNNVNPNGQSIKLTDNFSQLIVDQNNADNVVWDGLTFRGSGNTSAIDVATDCASPTFSNCDFQLCRHGITVANATLIKHCSYRYVGFEKWARDLLRLDGTADNGVFVIQKGYFNRTIIGGTKHDALAEGSIDFGRATSQRDIEITKCLIESCFDGCRAGEHDHVRVHGNVFSYCRDDGIQAESFRSSNKSLAIDIHDNLFFNCYHDVSHQGDDIKGKHRVYRNLSIADDPDMAIPNNYAIKTISTDPAASIFYFQNTWIWDFGVNINLGLWADFGGPSSGDQIDRLFNNIVIIPRGLTNGNGGNPRSIERNAVAAQSSGAASFLTAGGGAFAGTSKAAMKLNAEFVPTGSSPAKNLGRSLPDDLIDSRTGIVEGRRTVGAFQEGEAPGPNWPRPRSFVPGDDTPPRWPNPGA